jgi:hypothetical protein
MASSGAGGNAPANCAGLPLCDDFETATAGGPPDASVWQIVTPNCSGTASLAIDDSRAFSGKQSLRIDGESGYCNHIFIANTSAPAAIGQVLYGRLQVYFEDAFGDGHTTFLAMKDEADEGKDLRMGGQKEVLMWNRESDDATLPVMSPNGVSKSYKPAAGTWLCIEFMIDGAAGELQTWIDGALVEGLVIDGESTYDIDSGWHNKSGWAPQLSDIKLGWEAYGGNGMKLWIDDVAFDSKRIGCAP